MKKISICVPCYNEENNVKEMYSVLSSIMREEKNYDYEIIFEDNASKDDTQQILRELASNDVRVKVILNNRNFGPMANSAYIVYQSTGDAVIGLPCDFQEPPELIPELLKQWEAGYKVVLGKKTSSAEGRLMYMARTLYYKIMKKFSRVNEYEHVTGFGIFDIEVIRVIEKINVPEPNFRNLVSELGYRTKLLPYEQKKRRNGKSGYTLLSYFNLAIESFVNTPNKAIRLITCAGVIFCFISFVFFFLVLILFFNGFSIIDITTILITIVCCMLSFLLFSVGLIGEYSYTILRILNKKPLVTEKERINF